MLMQKFCYLKHLLAFPICLFFFFNNLNRLIYVDKNSVHFFANIFELFLYLITQIRIIHLKKKKKKYILSLILSHM